MTWSDARKDRRLPNWKVVGTETSAADALAASTDPVAADASGACEFARSCRVPWSIAELSTGASWKPDGASSLSNLSSKLAEKRQVPAKHTPTHEKSQPFL